MKLGNSAIVSDSWDRIVGDPITIDASFAKVNNYILLSQFRRTDKQLEGDTLESHRANTTLRVECCCESSVATGESIEKKKTSRRSVIWSHLFHEKPGDFRN